MPKPKDQYAVKLNDEQYETLRRRLVDEIRNAKAARSLHMQDHGLLDFAWSLYEQRSQRGISNDSPRYGSADLTSAIGTEMVDTLVARAVKTIFVEPVWIVEGLGTDERKSPIVEQFMQWRQESVRLQQILKRTFTAAFVEQGAVVEVGEDSEVFTRVECVKAQIQTDGVGNILLDEKGQPQAVIDEEGYPVQSEDPQNFVEVKHTYEDVRRRGATPRLRRLKDFLQIPAHAEDARDVWARATRFYVTVAEVKRRIAAGTWDKDVLEKIAGSHERDIRPEHERVGTTVEVSHGEDQVEKEIWRVQFWMDLGKGLQCYIADVSEIHACILSLRCDWLTKWRTVYFNPYPRPYSVYGYSVITDKLLNVIEEHTAWLNMNADRATLKANAPLKRLKGSPWDPAIQPFGPGETIDVNTQDDVMPFVFEDVSQAAFEKEQACYAIAQRIIGTNDIAVGQVSAKSRTLGENEMATRESFLRTDDPIGNLQEAMEELGELMHAIEVQALRDQEHGMRAPASVVAAVQDKVGDTTFNGTFTAEMVDGEYRFKPRGSVESADPVKRMQQMVEGVGLLTQWAGFNPAIGQRLSSPDMAAALMHMFVTEFKPRDKKPFLAPLPPPPVPMLPPGMAPPGMPPGGMPPEMAAGPSFGGNEMVDQLLAQMQGPVQ
jgi:hypothetical protein